MKIKNLSIAIITILALVASMAFAQDTKKAAAPTKKPAVAGKKQMPPRDAKGRFMKKTDAKKPAGKKLPPRDPKTGRFMKKADVKKPAGKTMPARDPKTGRFMKKTDAKKPAAKPAAKKAA